MVAVSANETMLIPRIRGSRKLSALAPPLPPMTIPAGPLARCICMDAMPV
jgi:hypothetical protein